MKSYEEICKALNQKEMERYEAIEEAMQMLDSRDMGKQAYNKIVKDYNKFCETLDTKILDNIAKQLIKITGRIF